MIKGKGMNYPVVKITQDMIDRADIKGKMMGKLKNSITEGERNTEAFVGEEVANVIIKGVISNTYNYDIVKGKVKMDVKTKVVTSVPRPNYNCSVTATNTKQECDYYVFTRINEAYSEAWFLGFITKVEFKKKAFLLKKGELDDGWPVKADCWNVKIRDLQTIDKINFE